jgi:hypothetical protein
MKRTATKRTASEARHILRVREPDGTIHVAELRPIRRLPLAAEFARKLSSFLAKPAAAMEYESAPRFAWRLRDALEAADAALQLCAVQVVRGRRIVLELVAGLPVAPAKVA